MLAATWRQISHLHALFWAAMVQLGRREPAPDPPPPGHRVDPAELAWQAMDSWHWATHQIRAALTFSARRTDDEYGLARQLVDELPLVWQALSAGQLDPSKAKVFARYLINLTPAQSELICRRLLPRAPRWTSGQLAHRLLREVLAIDPTYARRRYEKAARERGVWGYIAEDGTAVLAGHGLSPTEAAAAAERLEQLAAAVRAAGHPHTERQLRADLFVRLLDGRYTGFSTDDIIAAMLTDTVYATDGDPEPAAGPPAAEPTADGPTSSAAEPAATAAAAAAATEPGATEPDVAETDAAEPAPVQPGAGERVVAEPVAARPGAAETVVAEPVAAQPAEARPGAAETDAAQPGATEPGAECAASDPSVDEPIPACPVIAESAAGEPEPVAQPAPPQPDPAPDHPPAPRESTRAGVEIRVGLSTLLGLDDHPGELPGWGPVDAQESRRLVGRQHAAEWRFAVLDDDGYLIYGGLTRRRPTRRRPPRTPDHRHHPSQPNRRVPRRRCGDPHPGRAAHPVGPQPRPAAGLGGSGGRHRSAVRRPRPRPGGVGCRPGSSAAQRRPAPARADARPHLRGAGLPTPRPQVRCGSHPRSRPRWTDRAGECGTPMSAAPHDEAPRRVDVDPAGAGPLPLAQPVGPAVPHPG